MMKDIRFSYAKAVSAEAVAAYQAQVATAQEQLVNGTGLGNDFLGWMNLPADIRPQLADIQATADLLRKECEVIVCIGIGGSYLGAKAVIDALSSSFAWLEGEKPAMVYAGQNIGEDYLYELQALLKNKKFGIISISKSGTTTEPALAFRLLKTQLEEQQGKEAAKQLIVCITDAKRGALRTLATQEGYKTFVIEDNIGGRFSVLSPVGLLPIACAGLDICALIDGAERMMEVCGINTPMEENPAAQYAAARNHLYGVQGKKIEMLVNYHPKLHNVSEWWKQLYGESEGKDGKGIFPATAEFTADLHSLGQMIQEGERNLFETMVRFDAPQQKMTIMEDVKNLDGLNYIAGKTLDFVDEKAYLGTVAAHVDGGVPVISVDCGELDAKKLGEMFYFFELSCGVSAYILGVNPFNQPGVELYKRNMFQLLGKPGYEAK